MTSGQITAVAAETPIQRLHREFILEYDRADELCSKVQLFRQAAGIPAINEMRYAGYHLRHAFNEAGQLVDIDQIRRAKSHAQRASYEAAEAGLLLALKEINLFRDDYRKVVVTSDVKDYVSILRDCEEAKGRLGVRRQLGDDQNLDHVRHRELFETLSAAADMLHIARPEINKRMLEARTTKVRWIITTCIAISLAALAFFKERIFSLF